VQTRAQTPRWVGSCARCSARAEPEYAPAFRTGWSWMLARMCEFLIRFGCRHVDASQTARRIRRLGRRSMSGPWSARNGADRSRHVVQGRHEQFERVRGSRSLRAQHWQSVRLGSSSNTVCHGAGRRAACSLTAIRRGALAVTTSASAMDVEAVISGSEVSGVPATPCCRPGRRRARHRRGRVQAGRTTLARGEEPREPLETTPAGGGSPVTA
jgi:hypothetical protein